MLAETITATWSTRAVPITDRPRSIDTELLERQQQDAAAVDRRCPHCQGRMPADVGAYIVGAVDDRIAFLCSQACADQAEEIHP